MYSINIMLKTPNQNVNLIIDYYFQEIFKISDILQYVCLLASPSCTRTKSFPDH